MTTIDATITINDEEVEVEINFDYHRDEPECGFVGGPSLLTVFCGQKEIWSWCNRKVPNYEQIEDAAYKAIESHIEEARYETAIDRADW